MLKYQQKLKANSKCKIEDFPSYLDKIDTKDAKEELKNVRKRIAKI